jgi:hypothetical protein
VVERQDQERLGRRADVEGRKAVAMQGASARKAETALRPAVAGDSYRVAELLDGKERAVARRVRDFMEIEVASVIEDYWARDRFSFEIIPGGPAR